MQTLGQRLHQLRQNKSLARTALAAKIGVSKTAIKNWEDDENIPKIEYLQLLAEYFDCDINYLMQGNSKENLPSLSKKEQIPTISQSDALLIQRDRIQLYWLIIEGDAMQPVFKPKHLVLIDPELSASPGDYVVAIDDNEQVLFRRWRDCGIDDVTGEGYIQLMAINPDYPPLDSRYTKFEVCGVATEHRIKLK